MFGPQKIKSGGFTMADRRNGWNLFILLLAGMVIGGFLAYYLGKYPSFAWLGYSKTFGFDQPFSLNLGIIMLTFGIKFDFNIGSLIGMAIGGFIYKRM
jgi:hypothetical protein